MRPFKPQLLAHWLNKGHITSLESCAALPQGEAKHSWVSVCECDLARTWLQFLNTCHGRPNVHSSGNKSNFHFPFRAWILRLLFAVYSSWFLFLFVQKYDATNRDFTWPSNAAQLQRIQDIVKIENCNGLLLYFDGINCLLIHKNTEVINWQLPCHVK